MQESVRKLEAQGARNIGVVRLFVSGESWYDRTRQILGIAPGAPEPPASAAHAHASRHHEHAQAHEHSMAFWRLNTKASFALTAQGLGEAPETAAILAERARALSRTPEREDVLILAHGPGDAAENRRWIAHIDARAEAVRQALPFRRVQVETLREDWPEKRKEAEARVRVFVTRAAADGGKAIVIPFRIQGFGPYARVLEGLDYVADRTGLLRTRASRTGSKRRSSRSGKGLSEARTTRMRSARRERSQVKCRWRRGGTAGVLSLRRHANACSTWISHAQPSSGGRNDPLVYDKAMLTDCSSAVSATRAAE